MHQYPLDPVSGDQVRFLRPSLGDPIPTLNQTLDHRALSNFAPTLDKYDIRIRAMLDQPFGKDTLQRFFLAEPRLRHVLLPLWKSGFLYRDLPTWDSLSAAYPPMAILRKLLSKYGDVDFNNL